MSITPINCKFPSFFQEFFSKIQDIQVNFPIDQKFPRKYSNILQFKISNFFRHSSSFGYKNHQLASFRKCKQFFQESQFFPLIFTFSRMFLLILRKCKNLEKTLFLLGNSAPHLLPNSASTQLNSTQLQLRLRLALFPPDPATRHPPPTHTPGTVVSNEARPRRLL